MRAEENSFCKIRNKGGVNIRIGTDYLERMQPCNQSPTKTTLFGSLENTWITQNSRELEVQGPGLLAATVTPYTNKTVKTMQPSWGSCAPPGADQV